MHCFDMYLMMTASMFTQNWACDSLPNPVPEHRIGPPQRGKVPFVSEPKVGCLGLGAQPRLSG